MSGIETITGQSVVGNYVASVDWYGILLLCLVLVAMFLGRRASDMFLSWVKDWSPISIGVIFTFIVMIVASAAIIFFVAISLTARYR